MRKPSLNYLLSLIFFSSLYLSSSGLIVSARLSEEQRFKLNELTSSSEPTVPTFGKVAEPIKGNIFFYQYIPNVFDLKKTTVNENTIKLAPKETLTKEEEIGKLKTKREELHIAEEKGLNFIQPSIELTAEEQKAIDDFFSRNEQEQLVSLWKATIERNKTIQFIIQKLSPANSPQQRNSVLSKTLGAAIFLPFYALQAFTDGAGAYYGSQVGGRVLGSVIEGKMQKNQTQLQLSQTESIILFMMIDEVAERLRQRYHAYKRLMVERALLANELEESKKDTLVATESKDAGAEVVAGIQRRSVEREARKIDTEIRYYKNALIELAGANVVNDLDNQLRLELAATKNTPLDFVGVQN